MKLNKIALGAAMALGLVAAANAAPGGQGNGTITFTGTVIDSPCSLVAGNGVGGNAQTIDFGQISNVLLKGNSTAKVNPTPFQLSLKGCDLSGKDSRSKVAITFSGSAPSKAPTMFTAKSGVNLGIETADGAELKNGVSSLQQQLINGDNTMKFSAYLQGDGTSAASQPGEFTSTVNFTLAYQ